MKNRPFVQRLGYALAGVAHALRAENSFRTQALVALAVVGGLVWLHPAPAWWALIVLTVTVVLAAELFNTALEELADHLHPDLHPRIRVVKDCAAAAVLVISLGALGVAAALAFALLQ